MKAAGIAVALAGLACAGLGLVAWGQRPLPNVVVEQPVSKGDPSNTLRIEPGSISWERRRAARPISPEVVAPPQIDEAELLRVEPRTPLSPIGRAQKPSEAPPQSRPLFQPVAVAAGSFEAQGYSIELDGIVPTEPGMNCGLGNDVWPCGVIARTAFRNFLRGRAVNCVVPPVPPEEILVLACQVGAVDPAAWLVENGWAMAQPEGPYAELEAHARAAALGIFGPRPDLSAPALPDLSMPAPLSSGGLLGSGGG